MSCDWNGWDVTAKHAILLSQVQRVINDGITIVPLSSLADPQSKGIEIKFLSEGITTE
jgi:hypothetical protein